MAQYERLKLSIVWLEADDVITASLGDNQVSELEGGGNSSSSGNNGGIFG